MFAFLSLAREKVALLIGNQNYKCEDLNDLQSPENDIRQLGNLLEKLGFKVISLLDLTHGEMMQALEFFYEMLAIPAVYALFYYSGHGFSSPAGRNFLIPVDATVPLRCDYNIDVETVTKQMRRKHSRAIVVLDCCRVESRYGVIYGCIPLLAYFGNHNVPFCRLYSPISILTSSFKPGYVLV